MTSKNAWFIVGLSQEVGKQNERGNRNTKIASTDKILALILKRFRTQREFAKAVGWSDAKLSYKLKTLASWNLDDALLVSQTLGITKSRFCEYFFAKDSQ